MWRAFQSTHGLPSMSSAVAIRCGSLMQDWQGSPASSPHSSLGYRTPNQHAQALANQFDEDCAPPNPAPLRRDGIFALTALVIRVRVSPILSTPRGMNSSIQRAWEAGWRQQLRDAVSAGGEVFLKSRYSPSVTVPERKPGCARRGNPSPRTATPNAHRENGTRLQHSAVNPVPTNWLTCASLRASA